MFTKEQKIKALADWIEKGKPIAIALWPEPAYAVLTAVQSCIAVLEGAKDAEHTEILVMLQDHCDEMIEKIVPDGRDGPLYAALSESDGWDEETES